MFGWHRVSAFKQCYCNVLRVARLQGIALHNGIQLRKFDRAKAC